MLNKVEVTNSRGTVLSLTFNDVSDGFVVEDITGLDPVNAIISKSNYAQKDGTQFHSVRRNERNILLKIGLEPDYASSSVQDLRDQLYDFFMSKSNVSLRFFRSEGLQVDILGMVETCEVPLFTKESKMDVSIICFDPDFVAPTSTVMSGNTTSGSTVTPHTYAGTVDTGFDFVLSLNRSLSDFHLHVTDPQGVVHSLNFSAASSLVSGDTLTITTTPGAKSVIRDRGGVKTSLLYGVNSNSEWAKLSTGVNGIRVEATGAAIPYTITYKKRYGGL